MGHVRVKHAQIGPASRAGVPSFVHRPTAPRQKQLPLPWQFIKPVESEKFAHESEAELARILTFYRVRWLYEPTSFVLASGPDGRPIESFTPDFFLPDHGLYIELTTMRQPLVTRKNRKLRRLKELYPGVQIKLLYRRDFEWLLSAYRDTKSSIGAKELIDVLFNESELEQRICALAAEIAQWKGTRTSDAGGQPDPLLLMGLAPGGITFKRQLATHLRQHGIRVELDRVTMTRYQNASGRKQVRLLRAPRHPVAGREILVVTDVVSSGLSLVYLSQWLRRNGAKRIEICALLTRPCARLIELQVRFAAFQAPEKRVVGFGLGSSVRHRGLPYIATIKTESREPESRS